jgi:molybdopterin-guanine dinucleotide biosynthesis protein B
LGGRGKIVKTMKAKAMTPPVFIFVGHCDSGKTTFVERLIPELVGRGLRVAAMKHAHHRIPLDTEGKDSWRYKQAGAASSMLVTPNALQLVADMDEQREPVRLAERFLGEADIVLGEGFSLTSAPKIEVLRRERGLPPRCAMADGLIAMVTDCSDVYPELPHFALDEVGALADFLLRFSSATER